jgi:threonine synthase
MPTSNNLKLDPRGNVQVLDSFVPIDLRTAADPADPSNLERMEHIFKENALMLRSFVYPADVSRKAIEDACKELFVKYRVYADEETSAAYAAAKIRKDITGEEDSAVVLIAREAPELDEMFIRHNIGEAPARSEAVTRSMKRVELNRPAISPNDSDYITSVLNSLNLRRIF